MEKAPPDAFKAPGASHEGRITDWSKFKGKNDKGMYHKDYNIDNETGRTYGYGPENKHAKMKHINIKLPNGKRLQ